jgi:hypothetical protein
MPVSAARRADAAGVKAAPSESRLQHAHRARTPPERAKRRPDRVGALFRVAAISPPPPHTRRRSASRASA